MAIAPAIIAVAISLIANTPLPVCLSRIKLGRKRLRIKASINTNMGRLLEMVDTRDTGPVSIARKISTVPVIASVSLNAIIAIAGLRRVILLSSLRTTGLSETSRKIPAIQKELIQYIFQKEIYPSAYLPETSAAAISRLAPVRKRKGLLSQIVGLPELRLTEMINAPATTITIASHCM